MLGFHRRTRSLIPVKDLAKYDQVLAVEEKEDEELLARDDPYMQSTLDISDRSRSWQLVLVFLIFFAEAIMASSLQPQLQMLLSSSDYCGDLSASYLRSILDCAYAFGGTTGVFWGYLADRMGRRRVTLMGLWAMFACCLSMGFATTLASCALLRFFAGMVSSTVICTSLTMIGDLSTSAHQRAKNVARLPLISLCGSVGPLMQAMVTESLHSYGMVWEKFPTLGSELVCGTILFAIALTASILLKETLPSDSPSSTDSMDVDCERAAFLTRNSEDTTSTLVDFTRPEPISIANFLQAPSLMVLVSSFCLLSLHAATFDVLLPHLGHSSSEYGGMGIPCDWLSIVILVVRGLAGIAIWFGVPLVMEKYGLVKVYRTVSLLFPAIYVLTPLLGFAVPWAGVAPIISVVSILGKHILAGSAVALVSLLVLNTTPDAYSAGTVVGLMQIASLFKAFAVAVSGTSYYFSSDLSVQSTNLGLWACLSLFGIAGAALAWFVKERPSVVTDYPTEVLCWEMCFDADAEKQMSVDSDEEEEEEDEEEA
ncbi:hypothetical protein IAQ61_004238 [Plenodomus lingam]|uniref:uncharacterized protein n=1 Tax=Leptosphaeria maculans TaxID=5022 RepID=UPI0033319213|nr:hypothetical protein IAQ61_004238 [Plenodomus lingam]